MTRREREDVVIGRSTCVPWGVSWPTKKARRLLSCSRVVFCFWRAKQVRVTISSARFHSARPRLIRRERSANTCEREVRARARSGLLLPPLSFKRVFVYVRSDRRRTRGIVSSSRTCSTSRNRLATRKVMPPFPLLFTHFSLSLSVDLSTTKRACNQLEISTCFRFD